MNECNNLQLLFIVGNHFAEGSLLEHDAHNLVQRVRSSHGGVLSIRIVSGLHKQQVSNLSVKNILSSTGIIITYSNLNDIRRD